MKLYKMPNGIVRRYPEGEAPDGAVLVENKEAVEVQPEEKAVEPKNKSAAPKKNKATKGKAK